MKNLFLLLALFCAQEAIGQGDLSGSLKGQYQTQKGLFGTLEVKNKQATKTGPVSALIEERNLLENGSFEHQTYLTGWTTSGISTISRETTVVRDGKASLKIVSSSSFFNVTQDSTLYAGQITGNGYVSVWINNTAPSVQVCSRNAGADKDCQTTLTDGVWHEYIVPVVFGATSNGVVIKGDPTTGTTYIDWARLVDIDAAGNAPVVGPEISYTPVFTNVNTPTNINFTYQQIGSNVRIKGYYTGAGGTSTNELRIGLPSGMTTSSRINPIQSFGVLTTSYSADFDRVLYILATSNKSYINIGMYANGANGLAVANNYSAGFFSGRNYSFDVIIPINELASSVPVYYDRCKDPRNCEVEFTAKGSSSCVVSDENLDWINGNGSVGGTGVCNYALNAGIFTQSYNCTVTPQVTGTVGAQFIPISINSMTVSTWYGTSAQAGAHVIKCSRTGQDYLNAKVNQIVGSFKDYVKTPNTTTGKVGFCSAKISATGVISDHLGGCFASCTNATTPVCTFTTNYWRSGSVPNCHSRASFGSFSLEGVSTTTTFSHFHGNSSGIPQSGAREYFCHGEIQ